MAGLGSRRALWRNKGRGAKPGIEKKVINVLDLLEGRVWEGDNGGDMRMHLRG